jgi:hypothetical protein
MREWDILRFRPFLDIILTALLLTPGQYQDILGIECRNNIIPIGNLFQSFILNVLGPSVHLDLNLVKCTPDCS